MIKVDLRRFMDRLIDCGRIGTDDAKMLQRTVLAGGVASRQEAELLLAVGHKLESDPGWREALTRLIVDFAVQHSCPDGRVTGEVSRWLAGALDAADLDGTALDIAYAVVEEAREVDEALLTFILRGRQRAPQGLAA
jgi:hypothetical protein